MARGITGKNVASINNVSTASIYGGIPILFYKRCTAAASSFTVVADLPYAVRIIDAWNHCQTTAGGSTARVDNGSNAVSDAMAATPVDTVTRAATLDADYTSVAKHSSIKVTTAASAITDVFVLCLREE